MKKIGELVSKTWFVEWNNPKEHGCDGEPEEVLIDLENKWCTTETRAFAGAYCVKHYCGHFALYDDNGEFIDWKKAETPEELEKVPPDLHHVHMVLEDEKAMRFSFIRKIFVGAHFEPTKGSKKQAEDYIAKLGIYSQDTQRERGRPWEEIIGNIRVRGDIKGHQGARNDLLNAERMIRAEGKTPDQIFDFSMKMQKHRSEILLEFMRKRDREISGMRQVKVVWHTGPSRCGKTYTRFELEKEFGAGEVFVLAKYDARGLFDNYWGQKKIVIDDYK